MSGEESGAISCDVKPKSMTRAKQWSDDIENLYRFQTAGYRDEVEYMHIKQVEMHVCRMFHAKDTTVGLELPTQGFSSAASIKEAVDRWPDTGFVKKLQRKDNTFYYYNKQRECEDREVHKVKVYIY
ncbi:meiosis expressed gene 1 protein homolog isoform X1 [Pseudophryne corroboree]|uniref:meiosis expressed gene 1 protein homolog isoform X1 n=1 Tax=Pseudophryne corroboree TaxID=495146 RepID=UPI003081AD0A